MNHNIEFIIEKVLEQQNVKKFTIDTIQVDNSKTLENNEMLVFFDYKGTNFLMVTENEVFQDTDILRAIVVRNFIEIFATTPPKLAFYRITILEICQN